MEPETTRLFVAWVVGWEQEARHLLTHHRFDARKAREAVLMVHLFAGYPRQLVAMAQLQATDLLPPGPDEVLDAPEALDRGREAFEQVYGATSEGVAGAIRTMHPDVLRWVWGHAYGRVLSRPGLDLRERELLAVAALTALGTLPQLKGHIRGARRCGASCDELRAAVRSTVGLSHEANLRQAEAWIDAEAEPPRIDP